MKKFVFAVMVMFCSAPAFSATAWQKLRQPIEGKTQAVGEYSNGCIIGAHPLPLDNPYYQVTTPNRLRYFGHPDLLNFIRRLSRNVSGKTGGLVLVGDMSMPAGGRFSGGHASHQSGLDVDIWLQVPKKRWTAKQLSKPTYTTLVRGNKEVIAKYWTDSHFELIKQAAKDPRVNRIFVHPAIKKQLCEDETQNRDWLRVIRPWFGHRAHMHVRLTCPESDSECVNQPEVPQGDGCGEELASWLKDSNLPNSKPGIQEEPQPYPLCQLMLEKELQKK